MHSDINAHSYTHKLSAISIMTAPTMTSVCLSRCISNTIYLLLTIYYKSASGGTRLGKLRTTARIMLHLMPCYGRMLIYAVMHYSKNTVRPKQCSLPDRKHDQH